MAGDGRPGAIRDSMTTAIGGAVGLVMDPELRRPLQELDMVRHVEFAAGLATVKIALTIVGCPAADRIAAEVRAAAVSVPGVAEANVELVIMTPSERGALTERLRGGPARQMPFGPGTMTRVVAVSSGKGGVGKSTLTANLAVVLAARGLSVGLVDADVHGFSIPRLMGLVRTDGTMPQPTRVDDLLLPPVTFGVKVVSIGMFLRDTKGSAVAWRGPMLHRTLQQFLTDVYFGDVDILLIDLPPGTGDVAISLGQLFPNAEVLVITTPQSAAADVAIRSGQVARQAGQRVIGVVENMAQLILPNGTTLDLFGSGGGAAVADALSNEGDSAPLLASIPLSPTLRADGDAGTPVVVANPDDAASRAIIELAEKLRSTRRGLVGLRLPLSPR